MMVDSGTEEEDFLMEALGQPSVEEEEDSETEEMEFEPTSGYSGDRAEEERAGKVAAKRKLKGDYSPGDGRKRQRSGRGSRRSSTVLQDSFPRFYAPRLPEDCSSVKCFHLTHFLANAPSNFCLSSLPLRKLLLCFLQNQMQRIQRIYSSSNLKACLIYT